ncbi:MAG: hypothetical protein H7338_12355 [Candidatus Sericytochromatia bacterium]|nr:hypothetical protein [Candidatus Sericytochromatia bacterium]
MMLQKLVADKIQAGKSTQPYRHSQCDVGHNVAAAGGQSAQMQLQRLSLKLDTTLALGPLFLLGDQGF